MIEFDDVKREITLLARGLNMARANEVFDGSHMDQIITEKIMGKYESEPLDI